MDKDSVFFKPKTLKNSVEMTVAKDRNLLAISVLKNW